HLFIEEALAHRAYEDVALPIGFNQTISQPFIVAKMTEVIMAGTGPDARILEIGTGCGYQTTVLAQLVQYVYSIERIAPLLEKTRGRLRDLGLTNVSLKVADGNHGWPQHAPFDGIIATAAAREVPTQLLEQLTEGGILVLPEGDDNIQQLKIYRKENGGVSSRELVPVRFVPLLNGVVRN
ncbi:MAG: protein-L-isoaspartate(D-aspartate) O-methyltransferase, partial [Pseudohongiellaceae bacterium]